MSGASDAPGSRCSSRTGRAREDVWTRATPVLAFVLIVEVILAGNLDWPLVGQRARAGRRARSPRRGHGDRQPAARPPGFALPDDVGPVELGAFVAIGGALQLIGGQTTSAWVVCAVNLTLLLVLYVWIAYGVASILIFTGRRIGEQLVAALGLLARAIPLLLLFSVVLFINTEMWQVFAGMNSATVIATGALLIAVGSVFLGVRLPREVDQIEHDVSTGPTLERRQRINVGLVLFVTQALQILVVAVAVGAFFIAFGALVVSADVIDSWIGSEGRQIVALSIGDIDIRVTVELLRVSAGIAALSGLYYSVAVLTDTTYREEFLEELTDDLRAVFADRARYLELRGS